MRPIRVHLDTSDYAAMYNALPGTAAARVRDELKEMVKSGQIEIGLSYHVVFELLQKADPKYRADRLARARLLRELCRHNAFPYPSDLGQGYDFSTEGLWVPRIDLDEIEIENIVRNVTQTMGSRPELSRHERKVLSKRSYFVEWVRSNPTKSRQILADHWPLLFGSEFQEGGDLREYLLGGLSRMEANHKLRVYITDPVKVYETWFENYGRDNPVTERRDNIADKLSQMFRELKDRLNEAVTLKAEIKKARATTGENAPNPEEREALKTLGRKLEEFRSEITSFEELSKHPAWIQLVGVEGAQIAAEIFYGLYREKRDIKPSDAIDLVHAMYLPHTDLWRGDRDFSNLLIKNRVKFYERVVPTLSELPGRIETESAQRRDIETSAVSAAITKNRTRAVDIEICSAEFLAKHPELYHYTTRAGFEGIVKTQTIWATHYRSLNDSTELEHFRTAFAQTLAPKFDAIIREQNLTEEHRQIYAGSGGPQKLAQDLVDSLYASTFEQRDVYGPIEPFVASFCTHATDQPYEQKNGLLSQWRGYSGGDGYCLVFDTEALGNLLADEFDRLYWLHLSMSEVTYDGAGVSVDVKFPKLFEACVDNLKEVFQGDATPELKTSAYFWEGASRFKHRGFFEEREVRIVAIPGTSQLAEYTKQDYPVEFQEKPLPDVRHRPTSGPSRIALFEGMNVGLPIKRIIVGPARSREELAEKASIVRNLVGIGVPVCCSETPWIPPPGTAT